MGLHRSLSRQRGQVAVIMALAMTGLLGATAVGIDLGFSYAHFREAQNAADAAALAGVQDVSRHYTRTFYTMGNIALPSGQITADKTNSDVHLDTIKATVASLPNFPSPASVTGLPTGTQLTAEYIRPDGTLFAVPSTGAITSTPPTATDPVGVKATVGYDYPTFFARVFGVTSTHVQAVAYAKLFAAAPVDTGAPFVVCGDYLISGAYMVKNPTQTSTPAAPAIVELITGSPSQINYAAWAGGWFIVHGSQLPQGVGSGPSAIPADCGHNDSGWKGSATLGAPCVSLGANALTPVPCSQSVDNGNRAGPLRDRVSDLDGCEPGTSNNCILFLPVSNGPLGSTDMRIVDYAPFLIIEGGLPPPNNVSGCNPSNCHTGQLLPYVACGAGCVPKAAFDPTNPTGNVTWKLVASATSIN